MMFLTPLVHPDIPFAKLNRVPDIRLEAVTTESHKIEKLSLKERIATSNISQINRNLLISFITSSFKKLYANFYSVLALQK